ncbi:MAG: DUF3570 domain-containing protein [Saprospiraceae bacterium]
MINNARKGTYQSYTLTFTTLVAILILSAPMTLVAQDAKYKMKGNDKEITADFLMSYYDQDGNNAAVTGGLGTEKLEDVATLIVLNIPIDTTQSLAASLGADFYSSASTDNIDNNVSSASAHDLRVFMNLGYAKKNLRKAETYGIGLGFSNEYDYTSISANLSWAKEFNEGNSELNLKAQAFLDRWETIFPIELRQEVSVPTNGRQSYNFQAAFSQVINRRMQFSVSGELIYMKGLLSTPFHRVYFQDQNLADIERLPDSRLKIPIGVRLNYFPIDEFVLRSYYRYYWDDFGINAHTLSLETPIKLNPVWSVTPFYRYHIQTGSTYFAPYGEHLSDELFYTSDYDLSALSSHKFGMGIKLAPLYGLARMKSPIGKEKMMIMKSLELRGAYYQRSTDLKAFIVSLGLSFGVK